MKNIAFALLVFGIPFLFPVYLVVELRRGVVGINHQTGIDASFEQVNFPGALFIQENSGPSIQLVDYADNTAGITRTDVVKPIANKRHRQFVN
jgi:hypothetical protein